MESPSPQFWAVVGTLAPPAFFPTHKAAYEYAWKMNQPAHSGSESACGYTYKVVSP